MGAALKNLGRAPATMQIFIFYSFIVFRYTGKVTKIN